MELTRRDFLKDLALGAGATAAAGVASVVDWPFLKTPRVEAGGAADPDILNTIYTDLGDRMVEQWPNVELARADFPQFAPYAPATLGEMKSFQDGGGKAERTTWPRVMRYPAGHKDDKLWDDVSAVTTYVDRYRSSWGEGKWFLAYQGVWSTSEIVMVSNDDLRAGKNEKIFLNAGTTTAPNVEADAIRLDNMACLVSMNSRTAYGENDPSGRGKYKATDPNISVFTTPKSPEFRVRLGRYNLPGETDTTVPTELGAPIYGVVGLSFAVNLNDLATLTGNVEGRTPAIHMKLNPGAPVTIGYGRTTDANGNFEVLETYARANSENGDLTVHLPVTGFDKDHPNFVTVTYPIFGRHRKAETETKINFAYDYLPTLTNGARNPSYEPGKNRVYVADMLKGKKITPR